MHASHPPISKDSTTSLSLPTPCAASSARLVLRVSPATTLAVDATLLLPLNLADPSVAQSTARLPNCAPASWQAAATRSAARHGGMYRWVGGGGGGVSFLLSLIPG